MSEFRDFINGADLNEMAMNTRTGRKGKSFSNKYGGRSQYDVISKKELKKYLSDSITRRSGYSGPFYGSFEQYGLDSNKHGKKFTPDALEAKLSAELKKVIDKFVDKLPD